MFAVSFEGRQVKSPLHRKTGFFLDDEVFQYCDQGCTFRHVRSKLTKKVCKVHTFYQLQMGFYVQGETSERGMLVESLRGKGTQREFLEFVEGYLRDHAKEGTRLRYAKYVEDLLALKGDEYVAIIETPILQRRTAND